MKARIILPIVIAAAFILSPPARAADDDNAKLVAAEKETCQKHLKTIYDAIQAYRRDHKDLPNWLSDLVPKYLPDADVLICPVTKRGGVDPGEYASDPKLKTSYGYQFRPELYSGAFSDGQMTYRDWKRRQMGLVGGEIPMVRCYQHGEEVLNLAFDGQIYSGEMQWESRFSDVVDRDELKPENLLKKEKAGSVTNTPAKPPKTSAAPAGPRATGRDSEVPFDELVKKARDAADKDRPAHDRYQAIRNAYDDAVRAANQAINKAANNSEKSEAFKLFPESRRIVAQMLAVAQDHPHDPATADSLMWVLKRFPRSYPGGMKIVPVEGLDPTEELLRANFPLCGEYLDIIGGYETAQNEYYAAARDVKTDEERSRIYEAKYPKADKYSGRLLALSLKAGQASPSLLALDWIVQNSRTGADFDKAVESLLQTHVTDQGISEIATHLVYSTSPGVEKLLRAITDKNPDRETRATATISLARWLTRQIQLAELLHGPVDSEVRKNLDKYYDKNELDRLSRTDPANLSAEAEKLFEKVRADYSDIQSYRGTLGEAAAAELFEIRSLAIGRLAPEIEGQDVDGVKFKLSDYRGKVVAIDFWGDW